MDPARDAVEATPEFGAATARVRVIACGALAHELTAIIELDGLEHVAVECLPARLHNEPSKIPDAVRSRIRRARARSGADDPEQILVGYADCGTGGLLARVCEEEGAEMIEGAHCYEFFAGSPRFAALQDDEVGSFYLTDFLVKHFDRMVWAGLGLDRHPELLSSYFGNYTRCVYLAQTDDAELRDRARVAAERLGLDLLIEPSGYGELRTTMVSIGRRLPEADATSDVAVDATDHEAAP